MSTCSGDDTPNSGISLIFIQYTTPKVHNACFLFLQDCVALILLKRISYDIWLAYFFVVLKNILGKHKCKIYIAIKYTVFFQQQNTSNPTTTLNKLLFYFTLCPSSINPNWCRLIIIKMRYFSSCCKVTMIDLMHAVLLDYSNLHNHERSKKVL